MNLSTKQKYTYRCRKYKGKGGRDNWKTDTYTLLYIK